LGTADDALVATPVGGMQLAVYLPTRVVELTVHILDLANAVGVRTDRRRRAAEVALEVLAGLARRRGLAGPLLLAATGRGPPPQGSTCSDPRAAHSAEQRRQLVDDVGVAGRPSQAVSATRPRRSRGAYHDRHALQRRGGPPAHHR
jgi:hypothetical protein